MFKNLYPRTHTCIYMYTYIYTFLPDTFNTTELVMISSEELQVYTVLSSSSVTLVITRSVNTPVVELSIWLWLGMKSLPDLTAVSFLNHTEFRWKLLNTTLHCKVTLLPSHTLLGPVAG